MEKPPFQFGLDALLLAVMAAAGLMMYLTTDPGLLFALAALGTIAAFIWYSARFVVQLLDRLWRQPPDA